MGKGQMTHIIYIHGPSASGKTTWANKHSLPIIDDSTSIYSLVVAGAEVACYESIELDPAIVRKFERAGLSVSFREFPANL